MGGSDRSCCVPTCGKTRKDDTILHSFPNPNKEMERYHLWTQAVGINTSSVDPQFVYKNRKICHVHFEEKFFTWSRRLSPGAIPTLFLTGPANIEGPLENVSMQPAMPSTLRGPQNVRGPLIEITNTLENVTMQPAMPSTSRGEPLPAATVQQNKLVKTRALLKAVKKLDIKNKKYALRLKKAMNLSENKTFLKVLGKFKNLAAIFTLMQFREVGKKKKGYRFSESEKIMALSLYKRSPRAYKWLQEHFVLPSAMTLSKLISKANLKPGINKNIFLQLKRRVKKMKKDDKLCTLLFDEMSISPNMQYNPRKDEISGFVCDGKTKKPKLADHALVFMIRGIQKNFKQPIAYTFCSGTTSAVELSILIKEIIRELHKVGLRVLATVCDQGTTNSKAINILIERTKRKYLQRNDILRQEIFEIDDAEVIPLYDPPHLIKGIRNNFLNKNIICSMDNHRKVAKWEHIVQLYNEDPSYKGARLLKKLTESHVRPDKFQKMKVKYATQVLSQKVARTMGYLAEKKILPEECTQTADVILFFDELFDSLNGSYENSQKRSGKSLLMSVTPTSDHGAIWSKAKSILKSMNFLSKDKQVTVPTIKNWLMTIDNVQYLLKKLCQEYKIKSVWMRHFNQDPLENFFGMIRSHGWRNTNPTAAGFESSFAALLINNLSGKHSTGSNCEEDAGKGMFNSISILFKKTKTNSVPTDLIPLTENVFVDFNIKIANPRIRASLQYVTGYMLKKIRIKIFKNCRLCKHNCYDKNATSEYLKLREYKRGKKYLTYPTHNLLTLFSNIQDLITFVIKTQSHIPNIKAYLKTILYTELNFAIFECETHKKDVIEYLLELSCMFFLCNWCRDVNKIINGTRTEVEDDDLIKISALNLFNKRKHFKHYMVFLFIDSL